MKDERLRSKLVQISSKAEKGSDLMVNFCKKMHEVAKAGKMKQLFAVWETEKGYATARCSDSMWRLVGMAQDAIHETLSARE